MSFLMVLGGTWFPWGMDALFGGDVLHPLAAQLTSPMHWAAWRVKMMVVLVVDMKSCFFFWMLTATFHRPLWFGKVSAFCFMDPNPPKSPPALKIKLKVFFGFQKPHTYIKFIAALVFPKPLSLRSGYPVLPSGTTHDLCGACFVDLFQWLVSCLLSLPAIWWSILKSLSVPSHSRNGTHSFENFSRSANCGPRRRVPFLHLMAKSQKRIWSSFQWIILL